MKKLFHLTEGGVNALRVELESLAARRRPIAERIKASREFGDLSENAAYTTARQEQELVESRIVELESILQNVKIIKNPGHADKVQLGSTVTLRDAAGASKQFQVVGTAEADPLNGKISDESPLGQALLGRCQGDEIEFKASVRPTTYVIVGIV
ncbi:MAG TPA: transcription elongation factor GreA [Candidatus Limnocylindria bacterium]|nr:transcription elongation factor GreA [Candidatus Limnocylindria bacterium]